MNQHSIVAIGEDNSPSLRELETCCQVQPSRQFACQAAADRYYFVNFATYRGGLDASVLHPADSEIDSAILHMAAAINGGRVGDLESTSSGHPTRELAVPAAARNTQIMAHVGVLTADPVGIHTPTDPELHQLFSFLTRCHPLACFVLSS